MSKIQQYISYIADSRARRSIRSIFLKFMNDDDANTFKSVEFADGSGIKDSDGYIVWLEGITVPTAAGAGYAPGCEFILSNASLGQCPKWVNFGTAASCAFYPVGPVMGYGFAWAGGPVDCVNGEVATQYDVGGSRVRVADLCFAGMEVSDDHDHIRGCKYAGSTAPTEQNSLLITNSADPLVAHDYVYAGLRDKCTPEFDIFAAGTHTCVGGNVAEAITVTGALAGDIALVNYGATDDTNTMDKAVVTANTLTVTMSHDPLVAHSIHYVILRERGTFAPSHYVAYAGYDTTAGASATQAKTVTGVLATDVLISVPQDAAIDVVGILKLVATANTITWTFSADPTNDHEVNYMVLRAY